MAAKTVVFHVNVAQTIAATTAAAALAAYIFNKNFRKDLNTLLSGGGGAQ